MGTKSYDIELLLNENAVHDLLAYAEDDEQSTSAYWDQHKSLFKVQPDGTVIGNSVLGNASTKRSFFRDAAHSLLQLPLKKWARQYHTLADCEKLGRKIAKKTGRQFTYDFLRHVFTLALIQQYRPETTTTGNTLIIGDGFGTMASLVLGQSSETRVIIVNLTKSLALDLIYLRRAYPATDMALVKTNEEIAAAIENTAIRVIAVQADHCDILYRVPIHLAVNIVSMQEMDLLVVQKYFDILRCNPAATTSFYCCNNLFLLLQQPLFIAATTSFYCCNRRVKTSNFDEYPWDSKDVILEEGICEWSQRYYSNKWPFFHRRRYEGKTIMHRFIDLGKR